jgi:hypothetical protein
MVNDQISNKGIKYDLKSKTAVFDKNKLTAQPPGFINHVDT